MLRFDNGGSLLGICSCAGVGCGGAPLCRGRCGGGALLVAIALLSFFGCKLALSGTLWVWVDVGSTFIKQTSYFGDWHSCLVCALWRWGVGYSPRGGSCFTISTLWEVFGWAECLGPFSLPSAVWVGTLGSCSGVMHVYRRLLSSISLVG